jgi:exodeoxyribonuclease III
VQLAHFGALVVANIYFPNGNGQERDNSRVPYKLEFYRQLHARLAELRAAGKRVLVLGDFNTAHAEIDLARPKPEPRGPAASSTRSAPSSARWLAGGWVDTFRKFHPGPGHYSWWSQRAGARERNVGWRIDYVLACPAAAAFVRDAAIHPRGPRLGSLPRQRRRRSLDLRAAAKPTPPIRDPLKPQRGPKCPTPRRKPADKRRAFGQASAAMSARRPSLR